MSDDNDFAARMRKRRGAPAPQPPAKPETAEEASARSVEELRKAIGHGAIGRHIPIRTESIEATAKTITFDAEALKMWEPKWKGKV